MNNIHLIPTRKTSKIFKVRSILYFEEYPDKKVVTGNQHIYITDNSEIKEGDWYYHLERKTVHNTSEKADYFVNNTIYNKFKKIILTTDQSLNNVQAIDDDFLKWFVKNPSCEEVKVESNYRVKSGTIQEHNEGKAGYEYYEYKIIIPKEKFECEHDIIMKYGVVECQNCGMEHSEILAEKPKQEIFKEFIKERVEGYNEEDFSTYKDFIDGAKWQQEQNKKMYSEDEVLKLIFKFSSDFDLKKGIEISITEQKDWFEQFKKK